MTREGDHTQPVRKLRTPPIKVTFKDVEFEVTSKLSRKEAREKGVTYAKN